MDQENLEDTILHVIMTVTMVNLLYVVEVTINVGITVSMIMVMNTLSENVELHFQTNAGMEKT